jgi:hypothetical protein
MPFFKKKKIFSKNIFDNSKKKQIVVLKKRRATNSFLKRFSTGTSIKKIIEEDLNFHDTKYNIISYNNVENNIIDAVCEKSGSMELGKPTQYNVFFIKSGFIKKYRENIRNNKKYPLEQINRHGYFAYIYDK